MSVRLYVGNLPKESVEREELQQVFGDASDSLSIKVIKDRKTGNCRGFAFLTVPNDETANQIIEQYNGQTFKENALKIEKAMPRSKNKEDNKSSNDNQNASGKSRQNKKKNKESGSGSSNKRRGKGTKKSKQPAGTSSSSSSSNSTATQPDPRWADELARLKEMLSAVEK